MEREQVLPGLHHGAIGGGPGNADIGAAKAGFARGYATFARSRIGIVAGRSLAGAFFTLLALSKGLHLAALVAERPASATISTTLLFWAVMLYQALQVAFLVLAVILIGVRKPAQQFLKTFSGGVVALAGTFIASFLIFDANHAIQADLAPLASLFLIGGVLFSIWSLATLGRCFSIMPEVRGLVTGGPYSHVRHPLYLGEIVATLGVLLPILSARNVAIFAAFCLLQLWRTRYEEATLSDAFPEYAAYRRRTARILPGIY